MIAPKAGSDFWLHTQQLKGPGLERSRFRELLECRTAVICREAASISASGSKLCKQCFEAVYREAISGKALRLFAFD